MVHFGIYSQLVFIQTMIFIKL